LIHFFKRGGMHAWTLLLEAWDRLGFCVRVLLDVISEIGFRLVFCNSRKGLPPVTNNILLLSATTLAEKIRKREITSELLVRACIDRIKEVNSLVNAVVDTRFEAALEEARKCDRIIPTLSKLALDEVAVEQPFLGVPFSTKEGIRVSGLHHSYGLPARKGVIATDDAACVRLLRRAGAIPLCVTNVSELGAWWNCSNWTYGTSYNPYSQAHCPGGSSGGEAALQTAAGIPISLGSDTGGSIRIPAAFCGLFGHKPTQGCVSTVGADIRDPQDLTQDTLQVLGPLCRRAEDLAPLLQVLLGDNVHLLHLDTEVYFTKCKFFYLTTDVGGAAVSLVSPEVRLGIQRVIYYLEDTFGVTVQPVHIPELRHTFSLFQGELARLDPCGSICGDMQDWKSSAWVSLECARYCVGWGRHTLPVLAQAVLERLGQAWTTVRRGLGRETHKSGAQLHYLKDKVNTLLSDNGVLLSAAHPTPAPHQYQSYFKPFNFVYAAVQSALGLPATVIPLGLTQEGLPLSVQISAAQYNDHLTLALAKQLEKAFGGWTPPFRTDATFGFY